MSHYPNTAELAAFRRAIAQDVGAMGAPPYQMPSHGGAWTDERQHGIGARGYLAGSSAAFDRREASAMRSRAYARLYPVGAPGHDLIAGHAAELQHGAPLAWCDARRCAVPSYIVPDYWDDEPRTPLPVAYGRSFTILSAATSRDLPTIPGSDAR
jgi:hypothetical protein